MTAAPVRLPPQPEEALSSTEHQQRECTPVEPQPRFTRQDYPAGQRLRLIGSRREGAVEGWRYDPDHPGRVTQVRVRFDDGASELYEPEHLVRLPERAR